MCWKSDLWVADVVSLFDFSPRNNKRLARHILVVSFLSILLLSIGNSPS